MKRRWITLLAVGVGLAGCWRDDDDDDDVNELPSFVAGDVRTTSYDGDSDDLLTGGLGKSGLETGPPVFADPANPTVAELRQRAIYTNYYALVDITPNGGFGVFYGPNVDAAGQATASEGEIAGTETIAYSDDGSGRQNVTLMVQVPSTFDPDNPCIMTAPSSGSRGIYGAISAGEWGLKRGCAVAYTDKGTGAAPHDLSADTVPLIDGRQEDAATAGAAAQFNAGLDAEELLAFNTATPFRFAFKHAHSQQNSEKDWGRYTLQAIEFAFYVLNEAYGEARADGTRLKTLRPSNTTVIAAGVSNGGGAAIAAAELDESDWIDGVVVADPTLEMPADPGVTVRRNGAAIGNAAKPLYDYMSYANVFQTCAAMSPQIAGAPGAVTLRPTFAANRCASLRAKGLLTADSLTGQADEALARLHAYGWEPEADFVHTSHAAFEVPSAVTVSYANAYSRSRVSDNLCAISFASVSPETLRVVPIDPIYIAGMFAFGNGIPPGTGIVLINNADPSGPKYGVESVSPSTGLQDYNVDGALCLFDLMTGTDATAQALRSGVDETRRHGNLHGKPALIVQGRSDALLPVNHNARPYAALNRRVEGDARRLSYVEVLNSQHFDSFLVLVSGFDTLFVPVHLYLNRALDAMFAHLKEGAALPPSQVVRTTPRGGTPGAAPALTAANVPAIAARPADGDLIVVDGSMIDVPN